MASALILTVGGKASSLVSYDNKLAPSGLIAQLSVPNNISNAIGIGVASTRSMQLIRNRSLLTLNGRPEILYIGADYCPYCAAERWSMIIALSRFGSFSNLHLMTSSSTDYSPSTPTFTFYNSTYSSNYLSFVSVEQTTNNPSVPLQRTNASENLLFSSYDVQGSIPFILFANRSVLVGANYDPKSVLYGRNWSSIAASLRNTSSLQAQSIIGTANLLTAEICKIENNTPAGVCSQPYVAQIEGMLR